jgi:hypothetical protein
MEWAYLIFDLLKGLAWPVVVLVLVLLFRSKLQELIPRVKKAGPSGLEFDTQVQKNIPTSTPGELKRLPLPQTAAISTQEKIIHQQLEQYSVDQRVDLLVNQLAQAQLSTVFERVYGAIYASQIAGLRALVQAGGRVPLADAIKYFDDVKTRHPDFYDKIVFDTWINFPKAFGLVKLSSVRLKLE